MEHQLHFEMPVNPDTLKAPTSKAFFPTTNFHHFHKDTNINFQLNRFLIPGLEDMFAEIGRRVENFDDWKNLFFAKAAAFEKEGNMDYAMGLYRAAEFFMDPADPNTKMIFEKYLRFFYQSEERKNLERISVPYGSNHLHGFRLSQPYPLRASSSYMADLILIVKNFIHLVRLCVNMVTVQEHAQSHCQIGNLGLAAEYMLGWIEEHSFTTSTNLT